MSQVSSDCGTRRVFLSVYVLLKLMRSRSESWLWVVDCWINDAFEPCCRVFSSGSDGASRA